MVNICIVHSISEVPISVINRSLRDEILFIRQVKLSAAEFKYILEISPKDTKNGNLNKPQLLEVLKPIFQNINPTSLFTIDGFDSKKELDMEMNDQKYQTIYVINKDKNTAQFLESVITQMFIGGYRIEENELWISVSSPRFQDNFHLYHFLNSIKIICETSISSLPILEITNMPQMDNPEQILKEILEQVFINPEKAPNFNKISVKGNKWLVLFEDLKEAKRVIPKINGGQLGGNIIEAEMLSLEPKPEIEPKSCPPQRISSSDFKNPVINKNNVIIKKENIGKLSGIVVFKSKLGPNQILPLVGNAQIIEGSATKKDSKKFYSYAFQFKDSEKAKKFIDANQNTSILKGAKFLEQCKSLINLPPGISIRNFKSLFPFLISYIFELKSFLFNGCPDFKFFFNNIADAIKFDEFMTSEERCINGLIITAYNTCQATAKSDENLLTDSIINADDSYPIKISGIPNEAKYEEIVDLCLLKHVSLDKEQRKQIKIKLITKRKINKVENIIVVYNSEEAQKLATERIMKFQEIDIKCSILNYNTDSFDSISFQTSITKATNNSQPESSEEKAADDPNKFKWRKNKNKIKK